MRKHPYEQPRLQLVSLTLNDVLLASTGSPDDPKGELGTDYTVKLNSATWKGIWG